MTGESTTVADQGGVEITRERDDAGQRVSVVDRIENRQFSFGVDGRPEPVDPDDMAYPVDTAVRLDATTATVNQQNPVFVVDGTEEDIVVSIDERRSFPAGEYVLDVPASIKLYLEVEGPLTIDVTDDRTTIRAARGMRLGARSMHESPAGTVTTTDDVADLARAVSALASALKTTSPERAWPTLRGHPPRIERGDDLVVPANLEPPDTGIAVEIRPTLSQLYPVAPLAYYLGAEVRTVPGAEPRLVADGVTHPLGPDLEESVAETLGHVLLCDCVVRREGTNDFELRVGAAVRERLPRSTAALFDADPTERLAAYLSVPLEALAEHVPRWPATAHVEAVPETVETLPYLCDELATVRIAPAPGAGDPVDGGAGAGPSVVREVDGERRRAALSSTDAKTALYVGEGEPVGADRVVRAGYEAGTDLTPGEGPITVDVVCNEPGMIGELVATSGVYSQRTREQLPFDVRLHTGTTVAELRALLAGDVTLLHYVGHATDGGLPCADGHLDARDLDPGTVGAEAFILNACRSYEQGLALCERGAVAGVVSHAAVDNQPATGVGKRIARLVNAGFPMRDALSIARRVDDAAGQYTTVGDGRYSATQPKYTPAAVCEVHEFRDDEVVRTVHPSTAGELPLGAVYLPTTESEGPFEIVPEPAGPGAVDRRDFAESLEQDHYPVIVDGDLRWAPSFAEELRE